MSQIVKQTIRVRSGNGRRTDAPTVAFAESPLTRMGLLMLRSVSAGAFASLAEYGNMDASNSSRYAFIFMPNIRARDGAPLFRVGEIFHCHSRGCSQSLLRDTVKTPGLGRLRKVIEDTLKVSFPKTPSVVLDYVFCRLHRSRNIARVPNPPSRIAAVHP
jgi:hypothetical protein